MFPPMTPTNERIRNDNELALWTMRMALLSRQSMIKLPSLGNLVRRVRPHAAQSTTLTPVSENA